MSEFTRSMLSENYDFRNSCFESTFPLISSIKPPLSCTYYLRKLKHQILWRLFSWTKQISITALNAPSLNAPIMQLAVIIVH